MENKGLGKCPLCWQTLHEMQPANNVMLGRPPKAWMCHQSCKTKWLEEHKEPTFQYVVPVEGLNTPAPSPDLTPPSPVNETSLSELSPNLPSSLAPTPSELPTPTSESSATTDRPSSESLSPSTSLPLSDTLPTPTSPTSTSDPVPSTSPSPQPPKKPVAKKVTG
jgi:hypothetical protein